MAVKRYNGTSWDTVAGLGAQGAAATSSSITTWVKTASGGETSLTGSSDSSTTLAYTPGQEQVFINGVLQVRGSDYTATNGTSITGLTALVAGDIATVTTVNAFSVTGAVPLSTVTANGDLIVGTSSGAVGRLGVGSTSQVLTVSGGVPTWATPASASLSPYVFAYRSTALNLTNAAYTELVFDAESFDSDGCYNTTNGRFTPTTAGKYFVSTNLKYDAGGIDRWHAGYNDIRKNGSSISNVNFDGYDNYTMYTVTVSNSAIVECNGTTDYISTFYYSQVTTGTMQMLAKSSMTIFKVG